MSGDTMEAGREQHGSVAPAGDRHHELLFRRERPQRVLETSLRESLDVRTAASDPQVTGSFHRQIQHRGAGRRDIALGDERERRAVEPNQPLIRSEPQIAIRRLGDRADDTADEPAFDAPFLADELGQRAGGIQAVHDGRRGRDHRGRDKQTPADARPAARSSHHGWKVNRRTTTSAGFCMGVGLLWKT